MSGIKEQIVVRTVLITSVVTALYFVATVVAGISLSYSPVPFWDMWVGTLGFYMDHLDGKTSIWWAQHNEHRIIITRFLFWLDFKLANGSGVLLLATHPLLAALAVYIFYLFVRQLTVVETSRQRLIGVLTASLLTVWLFQWMQHENFAWAFQSQFFLAQMLPLLSLYLLARSITAKHRRTIWFAASGIAGVASAGTMANGVICLPLMVIYALCTRQSWPRVMVLAALTVLTLGLYFLNYVSPAHHGSITQALLQQPWDLARYVLMYLGTPFIFLLGGGVSGGLVAAISTALMAVTSFYYLITLTRALIFRPNGDPQTQALKIWQLALVFYIIYLAGTALGTGGGRLIFGVNQAISYRYTTPALMAWAALFVLLLPGVVQHWRRLRYGVVPAITVLLVLAIHLQAAALENRQQQIFDRALAALALEMNIRDASRIGAIHQMSNHFINLVDRARKRELSVFNQYPWRGLREQTGSIHQVPASLPACDGHLDRLDVVQRDTDYRLMQGWLVDPQTRQPATLIRLVDQQDVIRGFALGGQVRPDVADAIGQHAIESGFAGYMTLPASGGGIRLIADNNACELVIAALPGSAGEIN